MGAGVDKYGSGGRIKFTLMEDGTVERTVLQRGFPGREEQLRQNAVYDQRVLELPVGPERTALLALGRPWRERMEIAVSPHAQGDII